MTDEAQIPAEMLDNKNKSNVRCQFCNSLMLKPQQGNYLEIEVKTTNL